MTEDIVANEFGSEIVDPEFEIVNSSSNAMNIERFEKRMLTKPSNLSTRQAVNSLKMIVQGKYHNDTMQSAMTFISEVAQDGSSYTESDIPCNKRNFSTTVRLPPEHNYKPISKPKQIDNDIASKIRDLLKIEEHLHDPNFKFEVSEEAALFNWNLLQSNNFNFNNLLNQEKKSVTSYGSEFKNSSQLNDLLKSHPQWLDLKDKLNNGSSFPLEEIQEDLRANNIDAAFERGNHKSAIKYEEFLAKAIEKETKKGWLIITPEDKYKEVPGLVLSPMGVVEHLGVIASGKFKEKLRVTHDLSFPGAHSDESLNSTVMKEELQPFMFGHALLCLIHYIVNLRARYPNKIICIWKEDLKSAYRRMHLNSITAYKSAVRVKIRGKSHIFISARLPFGGSPCPNDFCLLSDMITDTINDLLGRENWNHKEVH